jgi:hypothetical protein
MACGGGGLPKGFFSSHTLVEVENPLGRSGKTHVRNQSKSIQTNDVKQNFNPQPCMNAPIKISEFVLAMCLKANNKFSHQQRR